jgi:hypothetical protein
MRKNSGLYIAVIVAVIVLGWYFNNRRNRSAEPRIKAQSSLIVQNAPVDNQNETPTDARQLSSEQAVIPYLKEHHRLPDYYLTKEAAREQGWTPAKGNLCDVLPGKIIGGDRFFNRDGQLPEKAGRKWFEADLNYDCATRNADRLLYSNDGLIFVTYDHYRSFQEK